MADSFSELEKRRILALLGEGSDLLKIASIKLYTTGKSGQNWLYSDLDGLLCYVIDYQNKTRHLILYQFKTYEKLFQIELYKNFSKYYSVLSDDFHCFETNNGFIGLKFVDNCEAANFYQSVKKFDDNFINQLFKNNFNYRRRDKYKKGGEYLVTLREKFMEDGLINEDIVKSYDAKVFEEGVEICKPIYYELLNTIFYNKEKKVFNLQNIPKEVKSLFIKSGLKKKDLKNESLALNIFKAFIICFDQLQLRKKEKTHKLLKKENRVDFSNINEAEEDFFMRKSISNLEDIAKKHFREGKLSY